MIKTQKKKVFFYKTKMTKVTFDYAKTIFLPILVNNFLSI